MNKNLLLVIMMLIASWASAQVKDLGGLPVPDFIGYSSVSPSQCLSGDCASGCDFTQLSYNNILSSEVSWDGMTGLYMYNFLDGTEPATLVFDNNVKYFDLTEWSFHFNRIGCGTTTRTNITNTGTNKIAIWVDWKVLNMPQIGGDYLLDVCSGTQLDLRDYIPYSATNVTFKSASINLNPNIVVGTDIPAVGAYLRNGKYYTRIDVNLQPSTASPGTQNTVLSFYITADGEGTVQEVSAATDRQVCSGTGSLNLNIVGVYPAGGTWSSTDPFINSLISGSSIDVDNLPIGNHELRYTYTSGSCENSDAMVLTVNPVPGIATLTAPDIARCGSGIVQMAASSSDGNATIQWFSAATGGAPLGTGGNWTTPTIFTTTTYYAQLTYASGCVSTSREPVDAIINYVPGIPATNDAQRCGSGVVTLNASGASAGEVYRWFNVPAGGSVLSTGATYQPNVSSSTTFYVEILSTAGCPGARSAANVTINPIPVTPGVVPDYTCGPGQVTLGATGAPGGGSYNWYNVAEGGSVLGTGSGFQTPVINTNTNYWVSAVSAAGCEGNRQQVVATVQSLPAAPTPVHGSRCGAGSVDLSAGAAVAGTFNWYATNVSTTSLWSQQDFNTGSISSTTSYWVSITDANGCESPRSEVIATVNRVPATPTAPDVARCGAGDVTLVASGAVDGDVYDWRESGAGPVIFTGPELTVNLTLSKQYFAYARTPEGCSSPLPASPTAIINVVPGIPVTFPDDRCGAGTLVLSAGGSPAGGTYRWYDAATNGNQLHQGQNFTTPSLGTTTSYWISSVSAEGCEGPRTEIVATVNTIPGAPVGVNGFSCGEGVVNLKANTALPGATVNWYYSEIGTELAAIGQDIYTYSLGASTSWWAEVVSPAGCIGSRVEVQATIIPLPSEPIAPAVSICGTGQATLSASGAPVGYSYEWFDNPEGGVVLSTNASYQPNVVTSRSYFVQAKSPDGCISPTRTEVPVTINSVPGLATVFPGSRCGNGSVALSAGGAPAGSDYRWYDLSTGGSTLGTGSTFDTPDLSVNKNYYVSILSPEGCEGARTAVLGEVNPIPDLPTVTDGERCGAGIITLNATSELANSTINWYASSTGGSSLSTSENFFFTWVTPGSTSYFASVTSQKGCVGPRAEVVGTVNELVPIPIGVDLTLCINAGNYSLADDAEIGGGVFSGPGVLNGIFYPEIAGVGEHTINYTHSNPGGCYVDGSRSITVLSVIDNGNSLDIGGDLVVCSNEGLLDLSAFPNIEGGTWIGSGVFLQEFDPDGLSGDIELIYSVDVNGCEVTAGKKMIISTAPDVPTVTYNRKTVCQGESFTASVSNLNAALTYVWTNSATGFSDNGTTYFNTPENTLTLSTYAQNSAGCKSEIADQQIVVDPSALEISASKVEIKAGEFVKFSVARTDVQTYMWTFASDDQTGTEKSNLPDPLLYYYSPGSKTVGVMITTETGCEYSQTEVGLIEVLPAEWDIITSLDPGVEEKVGITIFPSPVSDVLRIDVLSESAAKLPVLLTDLTGKVYRSLSFDGKMGKNTIDLDVSDLAKGMFLVIIEREGKVYIKKLIKE